MSETNEQEYTIPITWESFGVIKVRAESLEKAVAKVEDAIEKFETGERLPDGRYLNAFLQVDYDLLPDEDESEEEEEECF
jgi:hypothetical protein